MEKRIGSSAGLLALIALLVHAFSGSGGEKGAGAPEKKTPTASVSSSKDTDQKLAGVQGPWRATRQFFHKEPAARNEACEKGLLSDSASCTRPEMLSLFGFDPAYDARNIKFLIATIPDPLHTRMSMETDRDLDAIQRAAYRSYWELATQWLPWTAKAIAAGKPGAMPSDDNDFEHYPGLLVFRHHFDPNVKLQEILLVLIVAETPTAGVNGFQFNAARRLITAAASDPQDIPIAGPKFSGSFLSLTKLIEEWSGPRHFQLASGSVSNDSYAAQMLEHFNQTEEVNRSLTFHGFSLPSSAFEERFLQLADRWKLPYDQVASLSEEETGFSHVSEHAGEKKSPIPVYRYPRDIAQVRNNYNDSAFQNPAQKTDLLQAPSLEFSLKDTQAGEDIFPMFSTSHTPVSQNAELEQMIHYLRRKRIRMASLSATNVFDTVFLANILAAHCPDVRIVLRGPDLLFVQEALQGSLSGLMAVSAFPLFPEGTSWSNAIVAPENVSDMETFASSDQIGAYNAVSSLLNTDKLKKEQAYEPSFSKDGDSGMSAWLLELGKTGWLPIDLLSQQNPELKKADTSGLIAKSWFDFSGRPSTPTGHPQLPPLRLGWKWLCGVVAAFTFLFCGRLIYLDVNQNKLVWSSLCLVELPGLFKQSSKLRSANEAVHYRCLCMFSCYSTLTFINGLLLLPMLAAHFYYGALNERAMQFVSGASFVFCGLVTIALGIVIPMRICEGRALEPAKNSRIAIASIGIRLGLAALAVVGLGMWWSCCVANSRDGGDYAGYLVCFRTLRLDAPVAPLWPLLLSACGLFVISFCHLRRFTWAYRSQPHLDCSSASLVLLNELHRLKKEIKRNLYRPLTYAWLPGCPKTLVLAAVVIIPAAFLVPYFSMKSFEPPAFASLFGYLQIPLAWFTVLTFWRFLQGWTVLRALLMNLNSSPIGRFFHRVPEFGGTGPVWIREVKLLSLPSAMNSVVALHNLAEIGVLGAKSANSFGNCLKAFLDLASNGSATRREFIQTFDLYRRQAKATSVEVGTGILQPYWEEHQLSYVGNISAKKNSSALKAMGAVAGGSSTSSTTRQPIPVSEDAYKFAARYVALQYSVYISYVLRHLQNLLLGSIFCFVFFVAAMSSFVFQMPQSAFNVVLAALGVTSIATLMVLAQMERDPILSRLSGTPEGQLGKDFYVRALLYGALPLLSVAGTQFPAISRFISSWLEPALSKLQ